MFYTEYWGLERFYLYIHTIMVTLCIKVNISHSATNKSILEFCIFFLNFSRHWFLFLRFLHLKAFICFGELSAIETQQLAAEQQCFKLSKLSDMTVFTASMLVNCLSSVV